MHLPLSRAAAFAVTLALTPVLAGCVVEQPRPTAEVEVVAPREPPPLRAEVPPPPPRAPELVEWRPGRWHWDGREYVWVAGEWIERPHREARWVPGHWNHRPDGFWVWVPGHWR